MRVEGSHEWLEMQIVKPVNPQDPAEIAVAISVSIFREFAGEPGNEIILPRIIGGVVLQRGDVLDAYGNTGAHNGAEVQPVDIEIRKSEA